MNFEPFKTISPFAGLFNVDSRGYTQGVALDDPATRLQLCSGTVSSDFPYPLWGGVAVIEAIPKEEDSVAGSNIMMATATTCNAFTVFNQGYHGVSTANNAVPIYPQGGSVHYYRIGSGARIPLRISAAVAALATGTGPVGANSFAWDISNHFVDVDSGDATEPKLNISLLSVSSNGITASRNSNTDETFWMSGQPIGLFMI